MITNISLPVARNNEESLGKDSRNVVGLIHEAMEGGETTVEDEFEIAKLSLRQSNVGEGVGFREERAVEGSIPNVEIAEDSAVRCVGHFEGKLKENPRGWIATSQIAFFGAMLFLFFGIKLDTIFEPVPHCAGCCTNFKVTLETRKMTEIFCLLLALLRISARVE